MRFGALGDIHGDFSSVRRIMRQHPDIPFWVSVGDLADADGRYEPVDSPLYWIKGNNENFDAIASGDLPAGLHHIANGTIETVMGVKVAGLGGTYAPTMYQLRAADLPHPRKGTVQATALADRRRHFVREEVDACARLTDVDILLTHEAARPYVIGHGPGGRPGNDAGKTPINEVLAAMKPRLHLFGHHHRFTEQERQGVRSVGLDLVSKSYVLIERGPADALDYHVMT
jgi:predicted phosphodiesterase